METVALLNEARAAGLTVETKGGELVIRGPKRLAELAARVLANKSEMLAVIQPVEQPQVSQVGGEHAQPDEALAAVPDQELEHASVSQPIITYIDPTHSLSRYSWDENDHPRTASGQKSGTDRTPTRPAWTGEATELIGWFVDNLATLPVTPFDLRRATRVSDPATFYRSLKTDIEAGPATPRATLGGLADDLTCLRRIAEGVADG